MGTKKREKKKNKNKPKKEIKLTFNTSKSEFANNIIVTQQKEKLYKLNSFENIENEMNKHGICLTKEGIIEEYKGKYILENMLKDYTAKYERELKELNNSSTLFDDECISFYMKKLYNYLEVTNQVPNLEYIALDIMSFSRVNDDIKAQIFERLLESIWQVKDYTHLKSLNQIFESYVWGFEDCLVDCVGIEIHNGFYDLDTITSITNKLFKILEYYEFESPEYLYADTLGLLSQHGYQVVKEPLEKTISKMPEHTLVIENIVISELVTYAKKNNDYTDAIHLYHQALNMNPISKSERQALNFIKDNYSILDEEK